MLECQDELVALLTAEQGKPLAGVTPGSCRAVRRDEESRIGFEGSKYGIEKWVEIKYVCLSL